MPESVSTHDHRRTVRIAAQTQVYKPPQLTERQRNWVLTPSTLYCFNIRAASSILRCWVVIPSIKNNLFSQKQTSVWSESGLDIMWGSLLIGGIAALWSWSVKKSPMYISVTVGIHCRPCRPEGFHLIGLWWRILNTFWNSKYDLMHVDLPVWTGWRVFRA